MEIIEPWRTRLVRINLKEHIHDFDGLVSEIVAQNDLKRDGETEQEICDAERTPLLHSLRELLITPAVKRYVKEFYDYEIDDDRLSSTSWVVYGRHNEGVTFHSHAGSQISTVLYLVANPGDLIMVDPRGHACRGYPPEIRENHFNNHRIIPCDGDLWIFPSYVQHYVEPGREDELRVSLPTDYFFD